MRIPCPHCGPRDVREFAYLGDATVQRPAAAGADARERFAAYVYLRHNPAGVQRELWYHSSGCQAWLIVTRDTLTHAIAAVTAALGSEGKP
jgi:heterotetrameric sarcosine oxidase delta subunit